MWMDEVLSAIGSHTHTHMHYLFGDRLADLTQAPLIPPHHHADAIAPVLFSGVGEGGLRRGAPVVVVVMTEKRYTTVGSATLWAGVASRSRPSLLSSFSRPRSHPRRAGPRARDIECEFKEYWNPTWRMCRRTPEQTQDITPRESGERDREFFFKERRTLENQVTPGEISQSFPKSCENYVFNACLRFVLFEVTTVVLLFFSPFFFGRNV